MLRQHAILERDFHAPRGHVRRVVRDMPNAVDVRRNLRGGGDQHKACVKIGLLPTYKKGVRPADEESGLRRAGGAVWCDDLREAGREEDKSTRSRQHVTPSFFGIRACVLQLRRVVRRRGQPRGDDGERRVPERAEVHRVGLEPAGELDRREVGELPALKARVARDGADGADDE